ncbi:hypothetical protein CONCODRAFT_79134 [Conidiobolus coronatus NRRL 28638]|uniref:Uncharacterized protein n=1 Tax=Conidiobolus coronatus (strain ATCC 28846 / CBS 209.66 / NRRL 28638) TaxID=796925 RepID=A0A137P4H6_CONC2|nr:hypothetical protein CONCODRAFT_79134 [Conidiobolus coronatus NRRL 28638]|eukprot:KXN69831.1 hypothetical protein CONCODRAFT_79134 [Conidiobolus coronatus NRRL 28638]
MDLFGLLYVRLAFNPSPPQFLLIAHIIKLRVMLIGLLKIIVLTKLNLINRCKLICFVIKD